MRRRWPRWPLRAYWGAALVLVGAGGVGVSLSREERPTPTLVGHDFPVNPGARDQADINANNSPSLARNPRRPANLAVVNRVDTPAFSCRLHVSFDDGKRWSDTRIPIPKGEEPKCFAPDVAFARDGKMYVSFVTLRGLGNTPNAGWIVRSEDGGRTLSEPTKALGPWAFPDLVAGIRHRGKRREEGDEALGGNDPLVHHRFGPRRSRVLGAGEYERERSRIGRPPCPPCPPW